MSGLYSTPSARAPRLAAVITVRPSPEPRSMTKSFDVTLAMSSILSTTDLRRRDPDDVLAFLADGGLVGGAGGFLRLGEGKGAERGKQEGQAKGVKRACRSPEVKAKC